MTLVDDQQIDCIIRQEKVGQLRYLDIQINARFMDAKNPGTFAAMEIRQECGKRVMGFEKETHAEEVHGGRSVAWRKVR